MSLCKQVFATTECPSSHSSPQANSIISRQIYEIATFVSKVWLDIGKFTWPHLHNFAILTRPRHKVVCFQALWPEFCSTLLLRLGHGLLQKA